MGEFPAAICLLLAEARQLNPVGQNATAGNGLSIPRQPSACLEEHWFSTKLDPGKVSVLNHWCVGSGAVLIAAAKAPAANGDPVTGVNFPVVALKL